MLQTTILAIRGAEIVVKCAGVYEGAHVIVLSDKDHVVEAEAIAGVCQARGAHPMVIDISTEVMWYKNNLKRPIPKQHLLGAMMESNFCFAAADAEYVHCLGHTDENHVAQRKGMRWILVEEFMCEWNTEWKDIEIFIARTHRIAELMSKCKQVRVTTTKGADIVFPRNGNGAIPFVPIGAKMGEISPNYGESAMVPQEWTSYGKMVIDGLITGLGEMRTDPIYCDVEKGRIVKIEGGANAERFKKFLKDSGENSEAIAECGICTSHIEKRPYEYEGKPGHWSIGAWGTMHVGIGHNTTIGGVIKSATHVDCQMYDATVDVDDVRVIDNGKYTI